MKISGKENSVITTFPDSSNGNRTIDRISIPDRFSFPEKKHAHETISTGTNRII
jgi:hypothetical protein